MDAQATVSGHTVYLHTGNEHGEHLTISDADRLADQLKQCARHIRALDVVDAAPPTADTQVQPDPEPKPKPKRAAARKPRASRKKA